MSPELISILALVVMFVIATILPVNMGLLPFVGAFIVGTLVANQPTDDIIGGFPAGLFLTLVGITFLFAIAQNNGTIDWLVDGLLRRCASRRSPSAAAGTACRGLEVPGLTLVGQDARPGKRVRP
jgi:hypothetical protein